MSNLAFFSVLRSNDDPQKQKPLVNRPVLPQKVKLLPFQQVSSGGSVILESVQK